MPTELIYLVSGALIAALVQAVAGKLKDATALDRRMHTVEIELPRRFDNIDSNLAEIKAALKTHVDGPGHPPTITDVAVLSDKVGNIQNDLNELGEQIRKRNQK